MQCLIHFNLYNHTLVVPNYKPCCSHALSKYFAIKNRFCLYTGNRALMVFNQITSRIANDNFVVTLFKNYFFF